MHPEMIALMHQILDGAASPEETGRLEAHLTVCDECSSAWLALNDIHQMLQARPLVQAPPNLAGAVMRRVASESDAPAGGRELFRVALALLVLALLPAGAFIAAEGPALVQRGWSDLLAELLAAAQWAATFGAVADAWVRVVAVSAGEGPLVVAATIGMVWLVVWARLLEHAATLKRA